MFVDASAIVAILTFEPGAAELSSRLERASQSFTSSVAVFEASCGVARKGRLEVARAANIVRAFLAESHVEVRDMAGETGFEALEAHRRYGKGCGHPAQLNMGDCFAYAMAKRHRVPLLYKGEDFARTDLA